MPSSLLQGGSDGRTGETANSPAVTSTWIELPPLSHVGRMRHSNRMGLPFRHTVSLPSFGVFLSLGFCSFQLHLLHVRQMSSTEICFFFMEKLLL